MPSNPYARILVVDDDPDMVAVLQSCLESRGYRVDSCSSLDHMKGFIKKFRYDGILLDLFLGEERGIEAIPFIVRESPFSTIIVMTAFGSIEFAVEAIEKGAVNFVPKTDNPNRIVDELTLRIEKRAKISLSSPSAVFLDVGLLGQSPTMRQVFDTVERIAPTDATILIVGESGTGKELVARSIHRLSKRSTKILEALNCAAIPESLLESELFGHKRGAFTDAKQDRKGIFEICSEGTLFLDEIGEAPLGIQAKLLRVLQERQITPLGSSSAVNINTRIIAATNRDLEDEVGRGRFREDLYFRLNVISVFLPPLREHPEDIGLLTNAFIDRFNERYQKRVKHVSRSVLSRLELYAWPGNIRELQNAIERAVVLTKDDELHIEDIMQRKIKSAPPGTAANQDFPTLSYAEAKEAFEKAFLVKILSAAKGSIAEAARLSGRYRSDIYRLMQKYKIEGDEFKS